MNVYDVIALTIQSNGGVVENRTAIQKLIYFVSKIVPNIEIKPYRHYFYGPFSREVASSLEEMSAFSYINEIVRSGFYEKYEYNLTEKGRKYAQSLSEQYPEEFNKISQIVTICNDFCELRANPLSFAAKAYYVLVNTKEGLAGQYTVDDVSRVATTFDWKISQRDTETGVELLQRLGLVNVS